MIAARKKMRHLGRLTLTLLVFSSFLCCAQSAPAKPLNERSNELTWQAWLLVDDQNQNKQYDPDALIRRRITPKSVFIAPTFSPEALPDCADGFTADNLGKCVKIIEIDKDAHLDFILKRLNEQFGKFEEFADYEDDAGSSTEGPFNVKIPLDEASGNQDGNEDGDTNVAIVVAPTNGNFAALSNDTFKFKRGNATAAVDAPLIVTTINVEDEPTGDAETMTTTEAITTTMESSTVSEEATMPSEDAAETTTTTVAHQEEQALFFKVPNATKPQEEPETSEDKHTENFVRFPDSSSSTKTKLFEETQQIVSQLLPHANVKSKYEDLNIFNEYTPHKTNAYKNRDTVHQESSVAAAAAAPNGDDPKRVFNHRNRDKHWQFPTAWRTVPPQKPLVLRFNQNSKHHAGSFYQHHPRQDQGVYREVPPEELSYIFGYKRALSHR